jgi:hypothetical protein
MNFEIKGTEIIAHSMYKGFNIVYYLDEYKGEFVRERKREPVIDELTKQQKYDMNGKPLYEYTPTGKLVRQPVSKYIGEKATYWVGLRPKDKKIPFDITTLSYDSERRLWDAIDVFDEDFEIWMSGIDKSLKKDCKYNGDPSYRPPIRGGKETSEMSNYRDLIRNFLNRELYARKIKYIN